MTSMRRVASGRLQCSLSLSTKPETLRFYDAAFGRLSPQRIGAVVNWCFSKSSCVSAATTNCSMTLCDVERAKAFGKD